MTLKSIFIKNWKRLSLTYALFNIENILSIAKPYFLGRAIDMTIKSDKNGIIMFLGVYCLFAIVGGIRRINDTRTFTKIYSEVAVEIVKDQHSKDVSASKISARTTLSNKFVDFFETDVTVFLILAR